MNLDLDSITSLATILSFFVTIIAIIVSLLIYKKGVRYKNLECEMGAIESLVDVKSSDEDIKVSYKNQLVDNLSILFFRIENNGNIPIKSSDVVESLTVKFPDDVRILKKPSITKLIPKNLDINFLLTSIKKRTNKNILILDFPLLNPGDSFSFNVLWTGTPSYPEILCRIEGLNKITIRDPNTLIANKRVNSARAKGVSIAATGSSFTLSMYLIISLIVNSSYLASFVWLLLLPLGSFVRKVVKTNLGQELSENHRRVPIYSFITGFLLTPFALAILVLLTMLTLSVVYTGVLPALYKGVNIIGDILVLISILASLIFSEMFFDVILLISFLGGCYLADRDWNS